MAATDTQLAVELAAANQEIVAAGLPTYPGGNTTNLLHNMEHIIRLTQAVQRNQMMANAGILEVDDLLLVDEDAMAESLTPNTSAMCKIRLHASKRLAQDR